MAKRPIFRRRAWAQVVGVGRVIGDTFARFNANDGFAIASHVAMQALLALFPFLIFVTAVAGVFDLSSWVRESVDVLFETWPDSIADPIRNELNNVLGRTRVDLLTIGALLVLWIASNGVEALRVGLNRAYGVHDTRSFIFCRIQSIAFVLVGTAAILIFGAFIVAGPLVWGYLVDHAHWLTQVGTRGAVVRFGTPVVALSIALLFAHRLLPAGRRRLREILPGIAITIVVWIAGGSAFAFYLARFAQYATTYGALATVMTALIFLYLVSAVLLLGASLNAAIRDSVDRSKGRPGVPRVERGDDAIG